MLAQRNQELAQLKEQVKERANSQAVTAKQPTAAKEDARVAIIGYSCILPGGENVTETWDMIRAGIDNLRDLPADRVNLDDFYSGSVDKNPVDKIYCKRGGFIRPSSSTRASSTSTCCRWRTPTPTRRSRSSR